MIKFLNFLKEIIAKYYIYDFFDLFLYYLFFNFFHSSSSFGQQNFHLLIFRLFNILLTLILYFFSIFSKTGKHDISLLSKEFVLISLFSSIVK